MNLPLGDRMKAYEACTKYKIPYESNIVIRIDGKAFHTYTKKLARPYDDGLVADMNATAAYLCKKISNVRFAYVQSDEISLFIKEKDFEAQPWFDNSIQKMASLAASMATSKFNHCRITRELIKSPLRLDEETVVTIMENMKMAEFDARVFTLPNVDEVNNYFVWRQRDCIKNSISTVAREYFSDKELHKKNGNEMQEMMIEKGFVWSTDLAKDLQQGRFIERQVTVNKKVATLVVYPESATYYYYGSKPNADGPTPTHLLLESDTVRSKWEVSAAPIFNEDPSFIKGRI